MRQKAPMLAIAALFIGTIGCDSPFQAALSSGPTGPSSSVVSSIVLASASPSLLVGQTTKIAVTAKDAGGQVISNATISWSSSAANIAAVASDGTVSGLSAGNATIYAKSGDVTGQTTVAVSATATPPTPPASSLPSPAELPQVMLDTHMPTAPATGGVVINVAAGGDLQAAIDQAHPGDVITLAPGATYAGNFTLPNKGSSTSWIVIRPAVADNLLPAEGERMTPQKATSANLPKIISSSNESVFRTLAGANHYRLVGLEVGVADGLSGINSLISLGTDGSGGQTTLATVPHDLVLDRMYIHGNATVHLRRCVVLNSAASAVIDSHLSDCHDKGFDSQAILGYNGPGPFKIVNNYLQAAGEIIMFGGADASIPNLVPSDIEVRHNYFTRPLSWKGVWTIKNLFELKTGNRVLLEGNVMENNWADGQDGTAVLLKSVNQDGTAPWSGTTNVTVRLNVLRNVGAAFNVAAHPENNPVVPLRSVSVTNNVVSDINTTDYSGTGRAFMAMDSLTDVSMTHNTVVNSGPMTTLVLTPVGASMTRFTFANNIAASPNNSGVIGDNSGPGPLAMAMYAPGGVLSGNVFAGIANTAPYGSANFLPADAASIGFSNIATGDYSLLLTSPFKGKGTDGLDPGADMAAVRTATAGAVTP